MPNEPTALPLNSMGKKGGKKQGKEMDLERDSVCSACQSNLTKKGDEKK
jgi:hypothetical protein